jgi:hypothetical protein
LTARQARPLLASRWLYLPAVSSPIGGGLIKIGHGGTWAAVTVGVAPYAICALLYVVFVIGYLAAVLRYLCAGPDGQQAMARLIAVSASAVVSILTLHVVRPRDYVAGEPPRRGLPSPRSPR